MPLPPRDYFRLDDLPERWSTDKERVQHYISTGKLSCCVSLRKSWVNFGTLCKKKNGEEVFSLEEKFCIKGLVGLLPEDCEWIFRDRKTQVSLFYSLKNEDYYLQLVDDNDGRTIKGKDIVILRDELLRFERENKLLTTSLKAVSKSSQPSMIPLGDPDAQCFRSPDYRVIVIAGETLRFGDIQSHVIELLDQASKTPNPWLYGKRLLHEAGSTTPYMKDLFKRQKQWRRIVESDGKGRYRLTIFKS